MKRCPKCNQERPFEDFPRDKSRADGYYPYCKQCHRKIQARRSPNRVRIDERNRLRKELWDEGLKVCSKCLVGYPPSPEWWAPDNRKSDGFQSQCRKCQSRRMNEHYHTNKERISAEAKIRRRDNPRREQTQDLKKFDITLEEYDRLLDAQGGVCAICGRPPKGKRLAVDHDHTSGLVRGLLDSCNQAIGYLHDDLMWLENAAEYLRRPPATEVIGRRYVLGSPGAAGLVYKEAPPPDLTSRYR
jgi:hypothetical protein